MKFNNILILSTFLIGCLSTSSTVMANDYSSEAKADEMTKVKKVTVKKNMEKCYGIAKASKNDCAAKNTKVTCAGNAKEDRDEDAFLLVPTGTCDRIAGGIKK